MAVYGHQRPGETRVAATPETIKKLIGLGHQVTVQSGDQGRLVGSLLLRRRDIQLELSDLCLERLLLLVAVSLERRQRSFRVGQLRTQGVRIVYSDNQSGQEQTLYYFTTDISNGGISSNPGFFDKLSHQRDFSFHGGRKFLRRTADDLGSNVEKFLFKVVPIESPHKFLV